MGTICVALREIEDISNELARHWRDPHLMNQLTVMRGYAELVHLDSTESSYFEKLDRALQRLAAMTGQRGLHSLTQRIRHMELMTGACGEIPACPCSEVW
jgi:hypothetical protein